MMLNGQASTCPSCGFEDTRSLSSAPMKSEFPAGGNCQTIQTCPWMRGAKQQHGEHLGGQASDARGVKRGNLCRQTINYTVTINAKPALQLDERTASK
jgi:hypothetical protein